MNTPEREEKCCIVEQCERDLKPGMVLCDYHWERRQFVPKPKEEVQENFMVGEVGDVNLIYSSPQESREGDIRDILQRSAYKIEALAHELRATAGDQKQIIEILTMYTADTQAASWTTSRSLALQEAASAVRNSASKYRCTCNALGRDGLVHDAWCQRIISVVFLEDAAREIESRIKV